MLASKICLFDVLKEAPWLLKDGPATCASGTWTIGELQGWQSAAGLKRGDPIWSRIVPGIAVPAAKG
jgi:hypothetical protein